MTSIPVSPVPPLAARCSCASMTLGAQLHTIDRRVWFDVDADLDADLVALAHDLRIVLARRAARRIPCRLQVVDNRRWPQ